LYFYSIKNLNKSKYDIQKDIVVNSCTILTWCMLRESLLLKIDDFLKYLVL